MNSIVQVSSALSPETVRPRKDVAVLKDAEISLDDEQTPPRKRILSPKRKVNKVVGPKYVRPRPRRGLPLVLYWAQQVVRLIPLLWGTEFHFSNPKLTHMDALIQRYSYLKDRLLQISETRSRTVTVLNGKGGGGKTPTIAYLAALYQKITGSWNILLDLNQNVGTAARRFGIRRSDTLSLRDAIQLGENLMTKTDFKTRVKIHQQTGLRVISSADMDAKEDAFNVSEVIDLHDKADRIFDSVYQDTGNGMSHSCNIAAVQTADALVFPAVWGNDDAIIGIQDTLDGYFERGYGSNIHKLGYFVVLGTNPKWNKEEIFAKFCTRIFAAFSEAHHGPEPEKMDPKKLQEETDRLMQMLGVRSERFFMVPFSKYIERKKIVDTSSRKMGLASKVGYLEVLVSIYENEIEKDPASEDAGVKFEEELARLFQISNASPNPKEES
jgi:hypothetical protein